MYRTEKSELRDRNVKQEADDDVIEVNQKSRDAGCLETIVQYNSLDEAMYEYLMPRGGDRVKYRIILEEEDL